MLLIPAILAACASRGGGPYADLEAARLAIDGLTGRACQYIAQPQVPASLDALTRPGTRGSLLFLGREATPSDTVDVSVRYGADGRLQWVRAIRGNASGGGAAELERLLFESMAEEGPAEWGLRVRVVAGRVDAVLPSVVCAPQRGELIGQAMGLVGNSWEIQEARRVRSHDIQVLVALDAAGRIVDARLDRGTGSRLLDQHAVDLARSYRYYPKLHDGMGVPSVLPVRLRTPRP